jgi:hypothetical protein
VLLSEELDELLDVLVVSNVAVVLDEVPSLDVDVPVESSLPDTLVYDQSPVNSPFNALEAKLKNICPILLKILVNPPDEDELLESDELELESVEVVDTAFDELYVVPFPASSALSIVNVAPLERAACATDESLQINV